MSAGPGGEVCLSHTARYIWHVREAGFRCKVKWGSVTGRRHARAEGPGLGVEGPMVDYVTLTCPTCGSRLHVANDIERFICGGCGNMQVVKRHGGMVSLAPVAEELNKAPTGVDRTASEATISRLEHEVKQLSAQIDALQSDFLSWQLNRWGSGAIGVAFVAAGAGYWLGAIAFGAAALPLFWLANQQAKATNSNPKLRRLRSILSQKESQLRHQRQVVLRLRKPRDPGDDNWHTALQEAWRLFWHP